MFPTLGRLPVTEITPPMVLKVLRDIEGRPAPRTARCVSQLVSSVFVDAIALRIGEANPAAIVRGAIAPVLKARQPANTELTEGARSWRRFVWWNCA